MMLKIRKTSLSDIPELIQIEQSANQAFAQIAQLKWLAESTVMSSDQHVDLIQNHYAFTAVNGQNQAIGFLYAEKQDHDLYIIELDVSREYQQQGVGRQLMIYLINFAKQQGFQAITLTTFKDVAWNKPFYEKLGFQQLTQQALKSYLKQKIEHEVKQGFIHESRCAMRFNFSLQECSESS